MTLETLQTFLLYSLIFNTAIVSSWFLAFTYAHDSIFKLHSRWFQISVNQFDALNYAGMMIYKIALYVLNVAPLVVLWVMT